MLKTSDNQKPVQSFKNVLNVLANLYPVDFVDASYIVIIYFSVRFRLRCVTHHVHKLSNLDFFTSRKGSLSVSLSTSLLRKAVKTRHF